MSQTSLFDAEDELARAPLPLAVAGSRPALSKAQKRFNDLIAKIEAQRRLLQQWRDYLPAHERRVHAEVVPLTARLRERRIGLAMLLDQVLDGKALAKTHRVKAIDVLLGLLSEALSEAPDPELVRVYDKYNEQSFADEQQEGMALARSVAGSMFGVEVDADDALPTTPEELAQRIATKMQAAQAERTQRPSKARKPSAKQQARETAREQSNEGASRALREVYRKLASELHPDRETDPVLRVQKTAAMQKANRAYEARDLLALLELQLSLAQIAPMALAGLAQERLAHYNLVLEEQLLRLQEELADTIEPFQMVLHGRVPRSATPAFVARALDEDVAHLAASVREIEADLEAFRDPKQLKAFLRQHRIERFDDGMDVFESVLMAQAMWRR